MDKRKIEERVTELVAMCERRGIEYDVEDLREAVEYEESDSTKTIRSLLDSYDFDRDEDEAKAKGCW